MVDRCPAATHPQCADFVNVTSAPPPLNLVSTTPTMKEDHTNPTLVLRPHQPQHDDDAGPEQQLWLSPPPSCHGCCFGAGALPPPELCCHSTPRRIFTTSTTTSIRMMVILKLPARIRLTTRTAILRPLYRTIGRQFTLGGMHRHPLGRL